MTISDRIHNNRIEKEKNLYPDYTGKTMNIEITSLCNADCIYCPCVASGSTKKRNFIDEDFFYRITREARELGVSDVGLYVNGDPLMNELLFKYVEYLKKELHYSYVFISTNGILCTHENLERLAEAGIDSIKFSVSASNPKSYLQHHGRDAFEKIVDNIRYADEYRRKNNLNYKLYMFSILTRYNIAEKEEIEKVFGGFVDEIVFKSVAEGTEKVIGMKELLMIDEEIETESPRIPCNFLFDRIVISERGYLYVCCDLESTLGIVEDLKNKSLKDVLYGERMVSIRKMHLDNNVKGTLCDLCANGRGGVLKPFSEGLGIESHTIECTDITDRVKERFELS